jgi:hypothetical protein
VPIDGKGEGMRQQSPEASVKRDSRVLPYALAAALLAVVAVLAVPRAVDVFAHRDDPVRLANKALDGKFDAAVAAREIEAALASGDIDLAQSFVALAAARHVPLDPALADAVTAAAADAATLRHKAVSFARGLVTGVPDDTAALGGTMLGDLFVFGDVRDVVREGAHLATGQATDKVLLGLASAGLAVTAATYMTAGEAAPARAGLSLLKVARKTGRLDEKFMREAVMVERGGRLLDVASDVGRVERAAGWRAAAHGLKVAEEPADVARVAKLAEKEGSRTRAILKVAGRSAIMLAAFSFDVFWWILVAAFAVFGFASALKRAVERASLRFWHARDARRRRKALTQFAALGAHG